ncbi:MAG TPA: isoprenylcysteine carboxylmethyltransferase family protein [Stellaceae bacterium]|nr:isoprenylcysteine carboxylmethyltransferase family protein [Stellaceae bacterium]
MSAVAIVVGAVAAERLAELIYAARNTRALRRQGAIEWGSGHYPLLVGLHAAWLAALLLLVPAATRPDPLLLILFVALEGLRLWTIASLGGFWTTRILSLPRAPLVRRGPYRFLRHPNYAIVVAEIAVLPLAFGAWRVALVFAAANLALLAWRVRIEERALRPRRAL